MCARALFRCFFLVNTHARTRSREQFICVTMRLFTYRDVSHSAVSRIRNYRVFLHVPPDTCFASGTFTGKLKAFSERIWFSNFFFFCSGEHTVRAHTPQQNINITEKPPFERTFIKSRDNDIGYEPVRCKVRSTAGRIGICPPVEADVGYCSTLLFTTAI